MKKKLGIWIATIAVLIIMFSQFGIEIGNFRVGKQLEMQKQNTDVSNSDFYKTYYQSDSIICLNTWATWCEPCIKEIPNLNSIKRKYSQSKICFISLSIDKDSSQLKKFLDTKEFAFTDLTTKNSHYINAIFNLLEEHKADNYISSQSIPNTYLIKDKKVITRFEGTVDTLELIKAIQSSL